MRTSPVQVEFVCQYSPVVSTCVWDVQTAAQFASDTDRDPERTRTRKNRDTAAWIHQGRVDALDVLQKTYTPMCFFIIIMCLHCMSTTTHLLAIYYFPHKSEIVRNQNEPFRNVLQSDLTLKQAPPTTGNDICLLA